MRTPIVAVATYHLAPGRITGWTRGGYAVPDSYVQALRRAGVRPVMVGGPDDEAPEEIVSTFDGLLLAGGGDVDPRRYGAAAHDEVYGVDRGREDLEVALIREAISAGLPALAICRGIQVLNVALGGTLHQHLPDRPEMAVHGMPRGADSEPVMHDVEVSAASRLFQATGRPVLDAWSSHHQGLDRLGDGLTPVAWTGDGLVEGVEHRDGWLVGVQWHPEETADRDPAQQALFDALAAAARDRVRA